MTSTHCCSEYLVLLKCTPTSNFTPLLPHGNIQALTEYKAELRDDPIISTHLTKLYDNLLEQNLIRVIEPFSRVQVSFLNSELYLVTYDIPTPPLYGCNLPCAFSTDSTHFLPHQTLEGRI